MANRLLNRIMHGPTDDSGMPLGGTRTEATQRLQVGLSGIVGLLLLVALASTLSDQADQADAETVPEAQATIKAQPAEAPKTDPLADAGVVPDLPADTTEAAAAQNAPVLPEQGEVAPTPKPNRRGAQ